MGQTLTLDQWSLDSTAGVAHDRVVPMNEPTPGPILGPEPGKPRARSSARPGEPRRARAVRVYDLWSRSLCHLSFVSYLTGSVKHEIKAPCMAALETSVEQPAEEDQRMQWHL
jgi:hypothetical protein